MEFRKALFTASTKTKGHFLLTKKFQFAFREILRDECNSNFGNFRKLIGQPREVYPNFREHYGEDSRPFWFSSRNRPGLSVEWYLFRKFNIFGFSRTFQESFHPIFPVPKVSEFLVEYKRFDTFCYCLVIVLLDWNENKQLENYLSCSSIFIHSSFIL